MLLKRIIPTLIMKDDELIHRSNFNDSTDRYVGDPINTINVFNQFQVDEIILLNIENSKYKKKINFDLLKDIASEAFFPLTYGGGINNCEDAEKIISLGFEKISINSALFKNENLVKELSSKIGAQSIVISVDIIKMDNEYYIYNYLANAPRKLLLSQYLSNLNNLNIGELMVTLVNLDGSMSGTDIDFLDQVSNKTRIPIIYKGGLSNTNEIQMLFENGISAVASSTFFIMKKINGGIVLNYPSQKEKSKYEDL